MKHPGMINVVTDEENEFFEWSEENFKKAEKIIKKYPLKKQQSAVIPLLDLAQRQNKGWLNKQTIEKVAETLSMPFIRVLKLPLFILCLILSLLEKIIFKFAELLHAGLEEVTS
jgi:hypothetical protein